MRKLFIYFLSLCFFSSAMAAYPVKVTFDTVDADQKKITKTVVIKKAPQRIVVLEIGALDNVDALGDGNKIVGVPTEDIPKGLAKYQDTKKFVTIGDVKHADFEKIASLKPDLILLGFRSKSLYSEASKIAPTIDVSFDFDKYVDGVYQSAALVSKALDKEELANQKIKQLKDKVTKLKTNSPTSNALFLLVTGKTVSSYPIKLPRFSFLYNVTNFKNPFVIEDSKIDKHGAAVSMETIASINPDVIYVLDRGEAIGKVAAGAAEPAKAVLNNKFVEQTKAFKNKKIVYVDGAAWYLGMHGLNNFSHILDEIAEGTK